MGLYGIALVAAVMLVNICSLENYGAPVMSPISPFTPSSMQDVLTRLGMRSLGRRGTSVERLNGVDMNKEGKA